MSAQTAAVVHVSTNCAACGKGLANDIDAREGLDQGCRSQYSWRKISALGENDRAQAKSAIHAIAQDRLRGDVLRDTLFHLYELGFVELAQRIARRVGTALRPEGALDETPPHVDVTLEARASVPEPPPVPKQPLPFTPTADQERALEATGRLMAHRQHGVAVVVGYAGTGKTTLVRAVAHQFGVPICIAPTGKASLRIREATGLDAMTIHRFIYRPLEDPNTGITKFIRKTPEEIEAQIPHSRLLVLDEASMVGPDVWKDVIEVARFHGLRLLVVGDGFQLPPVQPPGAAPFSVLVPEFAAQLNAERVEMTTVLRQAQDNPIIRASMGLRNGQGRQALREIHEVKYNEIASVCLSVHQQGGVTICHRNVTRFGLNGGIRQLLGIQDEMPQVGEPLLVLKNDPVLGLVNGETIAFPGWARVPEQFERVQDRYKPGVEEAVRFGAVALNGKTKAVVAVEELHGKVQSSMRAISASALRWARRESLFNGSELAPHLAANFGYALTAHKSQGSQWPYVFVIIEPSIRLNEDEGRRWTYTAITRSQLVCGVYFGNVFGG